jgi:hypothetical protein
MSGSKIPMSALAIYSGQVCLGHILPRGKAGVEAFDADDKSLGIFPDQKAAADAVSQQREIPAQAGNRRRTDSGTEGTEGGPKP